MYWTNFAVTKNKFCLSLLYNEANSYSFVNDTEIYKFKAKDSEIIATPLCLGNISKDWSTDNMKKKKTGFNRYVNDFSVDYDATDVDDVVDIHKYLMKKHNIVSMKIFGFVKKVFFINSLSCISMNNQECKTRPQVINVNGDKPVFFSFSIKTSKCSGSCNNILTIRMKKFVLLIL